ncbi:Lrp/AsnC family transcriptional regulator [Candidatus Bathyarchaeota archaeon]|nr:Lrp/AsnC family transcriptional regulator [Candidatus Bathyarchaeota archaeon]
MSRLRTITCTQNLKRYVLLSYSRSDNKLRIGVVPVELKENELKTLFELIKGARRSDRELAKAIRVSQPTVTRTRAKLEKMGLVKEYTIIPDLRKMGYELLVFTFMSFAEDRPELFNKAREWIKKQPSVIFANNGEGPAMNSMMLSVHKNYTDYTHLITELKRDWTPNLTNLQSFIIGLDRSDLAIRDFSFRHLLTDK